MSKRILTVKGVFLVFLSLQSFGSYHLLRAGKPGKKQSSNVATIWMHLLTDRLRKEGAGPPGSLRMYAYTGLALYESQLPALPDHQSLFTYFSGSRITDIKRQEYYSPIAANAAVASLVKKLAILKSFKEIDSLEDSLQVLLQQQASPAQAAASIRYGRQIADSIFEWSKSDGTFAALPVYSVPESHGSWKPGARAPNPPPGVHQGLLRTFVKDAVTLAFPASPPAYSTDTASSFYKNANLTFEARNRATVADSLLIRAWQNNGINYVPMGHLTKLLTIIIEERNYSLPESSIIYAKHGIAMFDAVVSSFNAIYKYNVIRPVTYIREVMNRKDWNTLYFYDHYPSYPGNFAALVSASGALISKEFGASMFITDSTQAALHGTFKFASVNSFVEEVTGSRIRAGIDYPFAVEAGKNLGIRIVDLVNELPFKGKK